METGKYFSDDEVESMVQDEYNSNYNWSWTELWGTYWNISSDEFFGVKVLKPYEDQWDFKFTSKLIDKAPESCREMLEYYSSYTFRLSFGTAKVWIEWMTGGSWEPVDEDFFEHYDGEGDVEAALAWLEFNFGCLEREFKAYAREFDQWILDLSEESVDQIIEAKSYELDELVVDEVMEAGMSC